MQVDVSALPSGAAAIHPVGRIDMLTAPELSKVLNQAVSQGHSRLIVDLSEVPFIDSTGLASLISGLKAARVAGGDLRIAQAGDQVKMVFELTRLDKVLPTYASVEEAAEGY